MNDQPEPTTERLAKALEKAHAPYAMVANARAGYYDDYKSPLAFPITTLIHDLRTSVLQTCRDLADRAAIGEFDATKAEADAWAASPEGQEAFRELLEGAKSRDP